ncbi:PTS glucose transporter subunit IIA [Candidatus Tachikawaea gelatinosa]|uniref:PTS system glucose-specific EIIA component n=1 Tax=Candidatus Tachikawaea gelatinosa TaxID=1410383 RepID=A0A090BWD5_9ENTR|nr:PTS glucose transporter subunit IIA [Candidatus Tachikawaea gelatinosa]BAP58416.1 glucose-specific PTS system EIIA component [Candidatus Tachikawaea gelatinosa]
MSLFSKIFNDKKKLSQETKIFAPISGETVQIEDVPDVVFSDKIVGDGVAIKPNGKEILAPFDGIIRKIFKTNHAFSIESYTGIELFVHLGIDTINLKGEGFKRIGKEGKVKKGELIIEFDLSIIEKKAKSILTPIVISNLDKFKDLIKFSGSVIAGETLIMLVKD